MEEALTFLKTKACTTRSAGARLSSESEAEGEDGPYFDLEFSPRENDKNALTESTTTLSDDDGSVSDQEEGEEEEAEIKFECTNEDEEENSELFFKGDDGVLVSGASSDVVNGSKVPLFLLKLLLKLKKSKPSEKLSDEKVNDEASQNDNNGVVVPCEDQISENTNKGSNNNKFFTVKFNVHEVPLMSLFTRDNSSKEKLTRQESSSHSNESSSNDVVSPQERNKQHQQQQQQQIAKEVQKYLKMVKPFYVRVSKRYAEKLKRSKCGAPTISPPRETAAEESGKGVSSGGGAGLKQAGISVVPAGLRLVRKRLGKSRSASATASPAVEDVVVVPSAAAAGNRRDDSLLQVQDGIQGAIMHCKRSFNASLDAEFQ